MTGRRAGGAHRPGVWRCRKVLLLGMCMLVSVAVALVAGGCGSSGAWTQQRLDTAGGNLTLRAITFIDPQQGWAVGADRDLLGEGNLVIIATRDGGATWKAQDAGASGRGVYLCSVAFVDARRGWAVGDDSVILVTDDGGGTWTPQDPGAAGSGASFASVAFVDAEHGWVVGRDSDRGPVILATNDGGATWTTQDASAAGGADGLNSVSFVDDRHGWAVGGVAAGGAILATGDGGATWTRQNAGSPDGRLELSSVSFADTSQGWALGTSWDTGERVILATCDGGATWEAQETRGHGQGGAVAFSDAAHGWAVADDTVLSTSDGGAHWRALDLDGERLAAVAVADATRAWAVGGDSIFTFDATAASGSMFSAIPFGVWIIIVAVVVAAAGVVGVALIIRRRKTNSPVSGGVLTPLSDHGGHIPAQGAGEDRAFCSACGSPMRVGFAFCGSCGAKTDRRDESQPTKGVDSGLL